MKKYHRFCLWGLLMGILGIQGLILILVEPAILEIPPPTGGLVVLGVLLAWLTIGLIAD